MSQGATATRTSSALVIGALHVALAVGFITAVSMATWVFDDERDVAKRRTAMEIALVFLFFIVLRGALRDLASGVMKGYPDRYDAAMRVLA